MRLPSAFQRLWLTVLLTWAVAPRSAWSVHDAAPLAPEFWEAAYLDGHAVGYRHGTFQPHPEVRGAIESTVEIQLHILRFGRPLRLSFVAKTLELPSGEVRSLLLQERLGAATTSLRRGVIAGRQLTMQITQGDQPPTERVIPWPSGVLGLHAQECYFLDRDLTKQTEFTLARFEWAINLPVQRQCRVVDLEEVTVDGTVERLRRVSVDWPKSPAVDLGPDTLWIDHRGHIRKQVLDLPGIGELTTLRTTAVKAKANLRLPTYDLGTAKLIRLNRPLPQGQATVGATYRLTVPTGVALEPLLCENDRQRILERNATSAVLHIGCQLPPTRGDQSAQEPPEACLRSNFFLKCDDPRVKAAAEEAIGSARDPWTKARRIETWVHKNVRPATFGEGFLPADEVVRIRTGDCTEFAVLAAAMCRAVGVPARTAVGLVYVPQHQAMGFHLWVEVWVNGRWHELDPTMGQTRVGADHIKLGDQDWNGTHSQTPMMPLMRVLGKLKVELLKVEPPTGLRREAGNR